MESTETTPLLQEHAPDVESVEEPSVIVAGGNLGLGRETLGILKSSGPVILG